MTDTPTPPDQDDSPSPPDGGSWTILICLNRRLRSDLASCAARDSERLAETIEAEVASRGLEIRVERTVCMGRCNNGPTVRLAPGGEFYLGMAAEEVPDFLDRIESDLGLIRSTSNINALPPIGS